MSRPPIDTLGVNAALSVHEQALRVAQRTIDELRAKVEKLEACLAAKEPLQSAIEALDAAFDAARDRHIGCSPHPCPPAQRVPVVPMEHDL